MQMKVSKVVDNRVADVDQEEEDEHRRQLPLWHPKNKNFPKIVIVVLLLTAIIVLFSTIDFTTTFVNFLIWVEGLEWYEGPLVLVAVYIVATVLFIPGSILTIGAGLLFGFGVGFLCVIVGATIGACFAFLIGRYLFREWVEQKAESQPKFRAIDEATKDEGWKIVALLRLAPVMPFNLLNYALALTSVSFQHYAIASFFGMMPGTALYVWFGSGARTIGEIASGQVGPDDWLRVVLLIVTGVLVIVVVVVISRFAKKKLGEILVEEDDADTENEETNESKDDKQTAIEESIDLEKQ
eukprot:TRINITY_DN6046_c0_g1_i1.p1 TRINITY_DN6046_c0_g1~~TRINITY_DN6046_c0_g1_i1.p1  ORF type:complete len:297 (+),score=79.18 TRINITY_DN6046_c0_g1_i1:55-945(+)